MQVCNIKLQYFHVDFGRFEQVWVDFRLAVGNPISFTESSILILSFGLISSVLSLAICSSYSPRFHTYRYCPQS